MFKWVYRFIKHVHCFSDKKLELFDEYGKPTLVVMACNKCGLEKAHMYQN